MANIRFKRDLSHLTKSRWVKILKSKGYGFVRATLKTIVVPQIERCHYINYAYQ